MPILSKTSKTNRDNTNAAGGAAVEATADTCHLLPLMLDEVCMVSTGQLVGVFLLEWSLAQVHG